MTTETPVAALGPFVEKQLVTLQNDIRLLVVAGSGSENIPKPVGLAVETCVSNDIYTVAHAFGLLGLALHEAHHRGMDCQVTPSVIEHFARLANNDLPPKVAIIGPVNVGLNIALLAGAYGMEPILCHRPGKGKDPDRGITDDLGEAVAVVDIIFITVNSQDLIDVDLASRIEPGRILVNIARGQAISDKAWKLLANRSTEISIATDVWPNESKAQEEFTHGIAQLIVNHRIIGTPHSGARWEECNLMIVQEVAHKIARYLGNTYLTKPKNKLTVDNYPKLAERIGRLGSRQELIAERIALQRVRCIRTNMFHLAGQVLDGKDIRWPILSADIELQNSPEQLWANALNQL